jgi:hypothetical protein
MKNNIFEKIGNVLLFIALNSKLMMIILWLIHKLILTLFNLIKKEIFNHLFAYQIIPEGNYYLSIYLQIKCFTKVISIRLSLMEPLIDLNKYFFTQILCAPLYIEIYYEIDQVFEAKLIIIWIRIVFTNR